MAKKLAYAYLPQDASVLSKGYPFMGEVVEGTTKIEQKLKKNCTKIVQKARDYRVITGWLPRYYRDIHMTIKGGQRKNEPQENSSPKSGANILFFSDISKFPDSKKYKNSKICHTLLCMSFFFTNFAANFKNISFNS